MRNPLNKEQKSGIILLLASKSFERLAFYLIMAILIQYLMDSLKLESVGVGYYYSSFYGIIGLTTIFSGLIGDLKDRLKIVTVGFILLTLMYLAISILPNINYIIIAALIILGLGIGLISPNIIVFLGNIYNEKETEIIGLSGFILFSITINIGALIAPPLSIFLKDTFGYNLVFLFAALFGLLSLFLFLKFKIQYKKLNLIAEQKDHLENIETKNLNTLVLVSILTISVIIGFALNQKGLTFTFAVRDYIENGVDVNQILNNMEKSFSIISLLVFAIIVTRIKKLDWTRIFNFILIGLILSIIAFVLIASFSSLSQLINGKNVFIQSYILLILAETLIFPVISYSIYRSSPIKYKGLFQGIAYFALGILNGLLFLGVLLYEKNASMTFIGFAILLLIGAILIMTLKKAVNNKLTEIDRNNEIKADNTRS
jgi:MFS family permease